MRNFGLRGIDETICNDRSRRAGTNQSILAGRTVGTMEEEKEKRTHKESTTASKCLHTMSSKKIIFIFNVFVHTHVRVCRFVCLCMHVCVPVHMGVSMNICTWERVCTHICIKEHVCVPMCQCLCVCVCRWIPRLWLCRSKYNRWVLFFSITVWIPGIKLVCQAWQESFYTVNHFIVSHMISLLCLWSNKSTCALIEYFPTFVASETLC